MLKEFKEFLLRGNLIEIAVGLVLALAFTAVVMSLVANLITPLIAAIFGKPDFSDLTFTINESTFRYGEFLNALIAFVLIAAVLFFLVIRPLDALMERMKSKVEATVRDCPECLSEIPVDARRCAFCAVEVTPST
jgi:large conductance mechanosensitive channel